MTASAVWGHCLESPGSSPASNFFKVTLTSWILSKGLGDCRGLWVILKAQSLCTIITPKNFTVFPKYYANIQLVFTFPIYFHERHTLLQIFQTQDSVGDFPGGPVAETPNTQCSGIKSGLIPDQGTRSHVMQLRVCMPKLKILHALTKTWHSQINKYFLKNSNESMAQD